MSANGGIWLIGLRFISQSGNKKFQKVSKKVSAALSCIMRKGACVRGHAKKILRFDYFHTRDIGGKTGAILHLIARAAAPSAQPIPKK